MTKYKRYAPSDYIQHSNALASNVHSLFRACGHLRNIRDPASSDKSFDTVTAEECYMFVAPLLLTFAIELALKSYLCRTRRSYPKTHDPLALFDEIPDTVKDYLNREFALHNPPSSNPISSLHHSQHFRSLLQYHHKIFLDWRYQPTFFDTYRADNPASPDKIYINYLVSAIAVLLSIPPSLLR